MPPSIPTVTAHPNASVSEETTYALLCDTTVITATSPLPELPDAIRNYVSSLARVKRFYGNPITFNRKTDPNFAEPKNEHLQPPLSRVCRQLRDEVLPILLRP